MIHWLAPLNSLHVSCLRFPYPHIHWLLWRHNVFRQFREGEFGRAALLYIYMLYLHGFWSDSADINHSNRFPWLQQTPVNYLCSSQCQFSPTCWHTHWSDQNQWWQVFHPVFCYSAKHFEHCLSQSGENRRLFSVKKTLYLFSIDCRKIYQTKEKICFTIVFLTLDETFKILLAASTMGVAACTTSPSSLSSCLTPTVLREELRSTNNEPASSWRRNTAIKQLLIKSIPPRATHFIDEII